jgi:hypothetical protein
MHTSAGKRDVNIPCAHVVSQHVRAYSHKGAIDQVPIVNIHAPFSPVAWTNKKIDMVIIQKREPCRIDRKWRIFTRFSRHYFSLKKHIDEKFFIAIQ